MPTMDARFRFEVDVPHDLVRIVMSGFFTVEDVEAFARGRADAHRKLQCGPNEHLTLNDIRDLDVRSRDVVDAFRTMLAAPEFRSRRLAFVVTSALSRLQLVRTLDGRDAQCFEDMESAEAWLLADRQTGGE